MRGLTELLQKLGWFYGLTLLLSGAALWSFFEIAEEAVEHETRAVNIRILEAFHAHAHPIGDHVAIAMAAIGSIPGIAVGGLLFGLWLYHRNRLLDLATLFAALLGVGALTFLLKSTYRHARPDVFPQLVEQMGYSFPSAHASLSLALYGFVGGWLIVHGPRQPWRWAVGLACFAFAAAIGLSRLYLGVHWPTDMLAGQAIAAFWLAVCLAGRRWLAS